MLYIKDQREYCFVGTLYLWSLSLLFLSLFECVIGIFFTNIEDRDWSIVEFLALSFCLGLVVGVSIWVWQQFQLNRYISQVLRPLTASGTKVALPLIPRLRHELALVKYQGLHLQQQLQIEKLQFVLNDQVNLFLLFYFLRK